MQRKCPVTSFRFWDDIIGMSRSRPVLIFRTLSVVKIIFRPRSRPVCRFLNLPLIKIILRSGSKFNASIQIQNPVLDKDKILVKINASVQIQNPIAHVLIEVKLSKRTQLLI